MVGGEAQYWVIGGSYDSTPSSRGAVLELWVGKISIFRKRSPHSNFDMMFGSFLRQTVTLPQEHRRGPAVSGGSLSARLLSPPRALVSDRLRRVRASIAATNPGVGLPLVLSWLRRSFRP